MEYFNTLEPEKQREFRQGLELLIDIARKEPAKAAFMADNFLPEGLNRDALDAAIATGYESFARSVPEDTGEYKTYKELAEYFKGRSSYFTRTVN